MKDTIQLSVFKDIRKCVYTLWVMHRSSRGLEYVRLEFDTELGAQKARKGLAKAYALDMADVHIDEGVKQIGSIENDEEKYWTVFDPTQRKV